MLYYTAYYSMLHDNALSHHRPFRDTLHRVVVRQDHLLLIDISETPRQQMTCLVLLALIKPRAKSPIPPLYVSWDSSGFSMCLYVCIYIYICFYIIKLYSLCFLDCPGPRCFLGFEYNHSLEKQEVPSSSPD